MVRVCRYLSRAQRLARSRRPRDKNKGGLRSRCKETSLDSELEALFERVSSYFSLLSEPTRLKILNALCEGERTVSEIVVHTGATQSNVSRHLNLMYDRGALKRRRDGALTFYSVADDTVVALCRTVCVQVASQADDLAVGRKTLRRFMPQHDAVASRQERT